MGWATQVRSWAAHPDLGVTAGAALLVVLNLLDGVFTLAFLQLGVARELNPLMRLAYEVSPLTFILVKLAVVCTGLLLLARYQRCAFARWALRGGNVLYAAIVAYHLTFLARLLA